MLRRLLTILSAVSLVLCAATVFVWGYAGDGMLDAGWANGRADLSVTVGGGRGRVWVGAERIHRLNPNLLPPTARWSVALLLPPPGFRWRRFPPAVPTILSAPPVPDRRWAPSWPG